MRKTPQYKLIFYQSGDLYRASEDLDRMVIIDNQLYSLSRIVGDGVLEGWTVSSLGDLDISVSTGRGFISYVLHKTLTSKTATLTANATNLIYMRSRLVTSSGGFDLEVEGPLSNKAVVVFSDAVAPAAPTGFQALADSFDTIQLGWDANVESDLDYYRVERATALLGPYVEIATPTANGVIPGSPYIDEGLSADTEYFYRLSAVDFSGNESSVDTASATTLSDTRVPSEATNLRLFPGNGQISVVFNPSASTDVARYLVIVELLSPSDEVLSSTEYDNGLLETRQVTGLTNASRYRITIQVENAAGNRSDGISSDTVPSLISAPRDVTSLTSTPLVGKIKLDWTASISSTGSAVGQKSGYVIVVEKDGVPSAPINVGLVTTKTLNGYLDTADVGFGLERFLEDDVPYLFKVTAIDSFGNESGGTHVKGVTVDVTAPKNPRSLLATNGDESSEISWEHSTTLDVVGYNIAVDSGTGFQADFELGYVTSFSLTNSTYATSPAIANGTPITVRIRARDDVGNLSSGATTVFTPAEDTTPPDVITFITISARDEQVKVSWRSNLEPDLSHFLVRRQEVSDPLNVLPSKPLDVISEVIMNLGTASEFFDIGLTNGQTYSYTIKAVDTRGNESEWSSRTLVVPNPGLNSGQSLVPLCTGTDRLEAPYNLVATAGAGVIDLSWDFDFPCSVLGVDGWTYPEGGPSNFNVYRSEAEFAGYQLVASVNSSEKEYQDSNLRSGTTYYYLVSAVRDNADVVVDTGTIQPANTVLLAVAKTNSTTITSLSNEQRILESLQATLEDETLSRLLDHKHSVRPTNLLSIEAAKDIAMLDVADLAAIDTTEMPLSPAARAYYDSLVEEDGEPIEYDPRTIYVVHPSAVTYNTPFVGDFQIIVGGNRPTAQFTLDASRNAIVFAEALPAGSVVSLDGLGFNYYVPARLENRFRGFHVQVEGEPSSAAMVDEALQTIRFLTALGDETVELVVEPSVPEFGDQQGARQVSLSPDIVLSDFSAVNQTTFKSATGAFSDGDTYFVLVDGERTTLDHYVDLPSKSVVFAEPLPTGTVVSLEIRGKEEVDGELAAARVGGIDASQFSTGKFVKGQLPALSHEGRVQEVAEPLFQELLSSNNFVYESPEEASVVGTATTPYSVFQDTDGNFMLGTSAGLLRTFFAPGLLVGGDDSVSITSNIPPGSGLSFQQDEIFDKAREAARTSGRLSGSLTLADVALLGGGTSNVSLTNPSVAVLEDGTVLLTGGNEKKSYIYDPDTDASRQVASMSVFRTYHTCTRLPNGKVLVTGGINESTASCTEFPENFPDGTAEFRFLKSCEIYDPILEDWLPTNDMAGARFNHSATVLDEQDILSDVLVAGGRFADLGANAGRFKFDELFGNYCDTDFWEWRDLSTAERYMQSVVTGGITGTFRATTEMNFEMQATSSKLDAGKVVVDGVPSREIYDPTAETWESGDPPDETPFSGVEIIDGPIKQFMQSSTGTVFAVTRNKVFGTDNGGSLWFKTKGLEAVGVVHRIAESSGGTLFAATDLGVYEITPDILIGNTWFQGGLIGSGTTETFDLLPLGDAMLAATEIGIFTSSDDGETWASMVELDDVFNVEMVNDILFANSGQFLYRSDDSGSTWEMVAVLDFLEPSSRMVARAPLDIFFATSTGLYVSTDGVSFSLADFDLNRSLAKNNVHMAEVVGTDLLVGYDNIVMAIGPSYSTGVLAQFSGVVPTIRVNGEEVRTGFRYDTVNGNFTFEFKRFADDIVDATANYSLYRLVGGGWYDQNPNATRTVYVNRMIREDDVIVDQFLGEIAFSEPLQKSDSVTATIAGTTLRNEGEFFHRELEDRMEREKGLPLSMGRDYACNLLQMGLGIEHNLLERGTTRNQYCAIDGTADRSFNSFLLNSEFFIMGRKEYDQFNSTIDYRVESKQSAAGSAALVPLSVLEYSAQRLWVGSDSGIFVLDQSSFAVSSTISVDGDDNPVRDMVFFGDDVLVATKKGLYSIDPDLEVTRNEHNGLPPSAFAVAVLGNVQVVGSSDAIYYSTADTDPSYGVWFRASFVAIDGITEVFVNGACSSILVRDGTAFACIGGSVFESTSGSLWRRVFVFPVVEGEDPMVVSDMASFAERLYLGTNNGVYNDNGTARSDVVEFQKEETGPEDEVFHVNSLFSTSSELLAVGALPSLLILQSESWTREDLPVTAAHQVFVTAGGSRVVLTNNVVLVD